MSTNDALLLIGHGSARYPDASAGMRRHADLLRAERCFAQVEIGLLNGLPSVATALAGLQAELIRVVPFFMEDGYFSRVAVPRAVEAVIRQFGGGGWALEATVSAATAGRDLQAGGRRILLCPPIGTHDGIAGIVERQALAACRQLGIPSHTAAVMVVGHGSSSAPGRTLALHRHAARVAATGRFVRVEAACLEEAPFVPDVFDMMHADPVVVIGFFANHGGHVRDDVPQLIAAEMAVRGDPRPPCVFHGCVTDHPAMAQIVLDRAMGNTGAA